MKFGTQDYELKVVECKVVPVLNQTLR